MQPNNVVLVSPFNDETKNDEALLESVLPILQRASTAVMEGNDVRTTLDRYNIHSRIVSISICVSIVTDHQAKSSCFADPQEYSTLLDVHATFVKAHRPWWPVK